MSVTTSDDTGRRPLGRRLLVLARRALVLELRMYCSIVRAVARRPDVEPGGEGFRYDAPVRVLVVAFLVVSAVELVVVDLLVHRWPLVRVSFLVIGIWGLVWMLGLLCSHRVRPHAVGPSGLVLRDGMDLDLHVPPDAVADVRTRRRSYAEKPTRVVEEQGSRVLVLHVSQETDVDVRLVGPRTFRLPNGRVEVDAIRVWVDDPDGLVAAVRRLG